MALVVEKTTGGREYKVKDLSQADFGRLKIDLAEVEMPGLMSCRTEFGPSQPFKGAKITGAEVRWCSCNIFSTQDHAAAAIARDSASVFPWKRETLHEYWGCTERALDWGPGGGSDLIVHDGGDATLLIHGGVKAEEIYAKTGQLPDPSSTDNTEFQIVLTIIRDGLKTDPMRYHKMKERLDGVSEETTSVVKRLYQMQAIGALLYPAINVNDSFTKSKAGANVVVSDEVDPNQALKAVMRDFSVEKSLYDVVREADISVIPGINCDTMVVLTVKHVKKMEDNNLIYKRELDLNSNFNAGLWKQYFSGRYTNKWVVHEAMLSWSCTSDGKYEKDYVLAEHLEEKISALHLPKLTTIEKETLNSDNVSEPENSDKKGILEMVVRVCSLFGAAALRVIKASKVSINLLGPKVSIDIPLSAIWGN